MITILQKDVDSDPSKRFLVVKYFILPRTSLHLSLPESALKVDGVIRFKADLINEQIEFIKEQGKLMTETTKVHQLLGEQWSGLKVVNKLVRSIMREGMDKAGIQPKPLPVLFELSEDLVQKVSPFNPKESRWYSHEEFMNQAKAHLANTFGIKTLSVLDSEKNKDTATFGLFPYYRLSLGCGSCRTRVREMPREKWGCCGFSIRILLIRGKGDDKPHVVVREFVLTTHSVHAGYVPEPEEIDTAPKKREKDLTDDQLSLLKCLGRRRTDLKTVRAIFLEAYGLDLAQSLVYRVMKKSRDEVGKKKNEGDNSNQAASDGEVNDKQAKRERYDNCISLCKQISNFAQEDPDIYDVVNTQLNKLVNKCIDMENGSHNSKKRPTDDDQAVEEYSDTIYDEWESDGAPAKRARTS